MNEAISVVIPAHNQAPELKEHLPSVLAQDYEVFEVIVVDMASTDETKDILEAMELRYPNLRHTRTPSSARDISLDRLALTLGIRTAKYEWVVITHANCAPVTHRWLLSMSKAMQEHKDIVIGTAKYDEQRSTWFDYQVGFFRLWHTLVNIDHILSRNVAVRADGCNVALRRSLFLSKNGLGNHLNLLTGAEELLINQLSTSRNVAVAEAPEAIVVEDRLPERRLWKQHRVFYMETRRHQRQAMLFRTKQHLRLLLPWLLLAILALLWPTLHHFHPDEELAVGIITGLVSLIILILIGVWIRGFNHRARAIGYERSYFLTAPLFSLLIPLWNVSAWLTYLFSPRTEFRKKFV